MPFPISAGYARYMLGISYLGHHYSGWQANSSAILPSVQDAIKLGLKSFIKNERACSSLRIKGSSRTDAGVHAMRNTCSVDLPLRDQTNTPYTAKELCLGLNYYLSTQNLAILDAVIVNDKFDARYCATSRTYIYRIFYKPEKNERNYKPNIFQKDYAFILHKHLNVSAMIEASSYLLGKHDFTSFRNAGCQAKTPVRTITSLTVREENDSAYGAQLNPALLIDDYKLVVITVSANAFLFRMVRNIVSVLVEVGTDDMAPVEVQNALEARDRRVINKIRPAPAHGLYLADVQYEHFDSYAVT